EYNNLSCRLIDVEMPETASSQAAPFLASLLDELEAETDEAFVALRGNMRWIQSFAPVSLPAHEVGSPTQRLRHRGVYLITGGLGGIALEMAGFLAREYQARLVLTVRRDLPSREQWPHVLANQSEQPSGERLIRKVMELEAVGAEVLVVKADAANETEMRAALAQTLATFGELHGVLHAAGMPGSGVIQLKTWEQSATILASKVQGTLVLERVLQDQPLDFLALFSSMASITGGGPGQVDYCAANAFLDAYARNHAREHGITLALDWGEWQWNAWETELKGYDVEAQEFFKAHRQKFGISFEEGIDAFKRMLSTNLPNIVISTQDFRQVAERSKQFTAAAVLQHTQQSREGRERYPRPNLASSYAAPNTELERQITTIWEDLLGVSPVGLDDNFFELGGNSLTGIDVIARLKKKLGAKTLAAHVIYEAPTVSTLARYIEQGKTEVAVEEWQARSEKRRAGMKQRVRAV
ncbi:MAG: SDR family NAD(P)-dependent oxidoreductase, partial [Ktedonobacteraceae bacterium]